MSLLEEMAIQIELHSVEGIKDCFSRGVNPNDLFKGEPLIYELTSEYTRGPGFKECIKTFIEHGLKFDDPVLLSVLADDSVSLGKFLQADSKLASRIYTLRCAYTPLYKVTLLHICAEFNHVACAEVLFNNGADVNAPAGYDENRFGGHTAIFHTVNQNNNQSQGMLNFLLSKNAELNVTVHGLIWGKGYEWETFIPAVNPISYAMMGLLPQMHRNEEIISKIVSTLLKHAFKIDYNPVNIPCAYLKKNLKT
jgi:hypothetical protein